MTQQTRENWLAALREKASAFGKYARFTRQAPRDPNGHEQVTTPLDAHAKPFKEILAESIGEVRRLQTEADSTIEKLASGKVNDVSEAMAAVESADHSFQTMMAVRSHIVAAYQEVMRMQT